jgi:putative membrane protein
MARRKHRYHLVERDRLAGVRTALANQRTLLALIRTALSLGAAGGAVMHLLDHVAATVAGLALVVVGGLMMGFGLHSYLQVRRLVHAEVSGGLGMKG